MIQLFNHTRYIICKYNIDERVLERKEMIINRGEAEIENHFRKVMISILTIVITAM